MAAILDQITLVAQASRREQMNMTMLTRESALLAMHQRRAKRVGGKSIDVKARYKRVNGGPFKRGTKFDTSRVEQFFGGTLNWAYNYVNVTIHEIDLIEGAGINLNQLLSVKNFSSLPTPMQESLVDIVAKEWEGARQDAREIEIKQMLGDGTGANSPMVGYKAIISDSLTYAGISVSELGTFDYNGLRSGVKDNLWAAKTMNLASATVTPDDLATMLNDCNNRVDMVFMGALLYESLSAQLEGAKVRNDEVAKLGFAQNLTWPAHNVTFYADRYMDSELPDSIIGISSAHCEYLINKALDYEFSGFMRPTDEPVAIAQIEWGSQLRCDERSANFIITNAKP